MNPVFIRNPCLCISLYDGICIVIVSVLCLFNSSNKCCMYYLCLQCFSCQNLYFEFWVMQCLNDGTPEVRDAAFLALSAIAKVHSL